MINLKKLLAISDPPPGNTDWLEKAESSVDYALSQGAEQDTIIYASTPSALLYGVLAKRENVTPPDQDDLLRASFGQYATWSITYASSGSGSESVYLASPLDRSHCESLRGGEFLVVRRRFDSVDKGESRIEVSQKLVHALGLYWLAEQKAYCRLDGNGDIEPVIRILDLKDQIEWGTLVTINAHDLARYMTVTNTALVIHFDFTRVQPNNFGGWGHSGYSKTRGRDCFYTGESQPGASYANGILIRRSKLTHDDLLRAEKSAIFDDNKQYATFKAYNRKNNKLEEISCAPDSLASYFDLESSLPWQITPAFFRAEVLQRYKADSEKYSLKSRSISSRAGWSLQTYDVNEAGQVHTYLRYLSYLPYEEQLYWRSFNEWPKGPISNRAYKTDILAEWTDTPDPLIDLIADVAKLDEAPPDWWSVRGSHLRSTTHYPVTTSPSEWGDSILALDQLLVEGFLPKAIRARLQALNHSYEPQWQSLKLIQELMVAQGGAESDATDAIEPLRQLHHLRSKVKGHSSQEQREELIREARTNYGGLKEHFLQLAFDCQAAFALARSSLERTTP